MISRTIKQNVTFVHPFVLSTLGETQPAGSYLIEIDEELIQSLSFTAYRRVRTTIFLHAAGDAYITGSADINPRELEKALELDRRVSGGEKC